MDYSRSGLDKVEMIQVLKIAKDSAIKAHTQTINQTRDLIFHRTFRATVLRPLLAMRVSTWRTWSLFLWRCPDSFQAKLSPPSCDHGTLEV